MHTIARTIAPLLLTLGLLAGMTGTAQAEAPRNVRDGHAGTLDAGWITAACATRGDAAKCALRVPGRFTRFDLTYRLDGELLGVETSHDHDARPVHGYRRNVTGTVVDGVTVKCAARGSRIACTLDLDDRYDTFNVGTYSAAGSWGGLVATDVAL